MRTIRSLIFVSIITLCGSDAIAGNPLELLKQLGTFIDSMSVRGLDRRYIDMPEEPWQVIVKGNMNQSRVKMNTSGSIAGLDYKATPSFKTEPSRYVGLWAGYRGYGIGYTVNVGGDDGNYFTLGATGGAYGVNLRIHSFSSFHPDFRIESSVISDEDVEEKQEAIELIEPIKVHTLIADGYYMFNGKRFSYAAAYDQSVLQKRSAGSLMVGGMYYYGRVNYASRYNGDLIYIMHGLGKVKLWQGSLGMGYAYNWVPAKGLLVSAMAMPMITFVNRITCYGYNTNVEELMDEPWAYDEDVPDDEWDEWFYRNVQIEFMGKESFNSGVTVNFDARLSLTYNFSRFFVNVYGQYNDFRYRHRSSHGQLNDWFVNAAFGVRL